jgi:hypothetical protein
MAAAFPAGAAAFSAGAAAFSAALLHFWRRRRMSHQRQSGVEMTSRHRPQSRTSIRWPSEPSSQEARGFPAAQAICAVSRVLICRSKLNEPFECLLEARTSIGSQAIVMFLYWLAWMVHHHILGLGPRDLGHISLSYTHHILRQLVRLVAPSLRVGPASLCEILDQLRLEITYQICDNSHRPI